MCIDLTSGVLLSAQAGGLVRFPVVPAPGTSLRDFQFRVAPPTFEVKGWVFRHTSSFTYLFAGPPPPPHPPTPPQHPPPPPPPPPPTPPLKPPGIFSPPGASNKLLPEVERLCADSRDKEVQCGDPSVFLLTRPSSVRSAFFWGLRRPLGVLHPNLSGGEVIAVFPPSFLFHFIDNAPDPFVLVFRWWQRFCL